MASAAAPVLSTPAEHIFEEPTPAAVAESQLSDEQLYLQYEIKRTVTEIRQGQWKRIALQFPDDMLVDAPRVFERLNADLKVAKVEEQSARTADNLANDVERVTLEQDVSERELNLQPAKDAEEHLCILADTSYGACCVDEVAAEHVAADVVVHYGRACLSPTARLPVIYVFTSKPLDVDATVASFKQTYPDKDEMVCLMADIPYHHHLPALCQKLRAEGYGALFETEIIRCPSSFLPNRTVPPGIGDDIEKLKEYAIFHISSPPTSLLLILSSRVKSVHLFPTDQAGQSNLAVEASSRLLLRRRYALVTRLSTVAIFGILINTLSVSNYMQALQHCQDLISCAGKKCYVFVVGKINAAKVANFSEIGGWVVIGCWESSLIESKEFYRPIITPFELEVALTEDKERVWGAEWIGDFSTLLGKEKKTVPTTSRHADTHSNGRTKGTSGVSLDEQSSDDEPPDFDLRTGRYVSHSRPMKNQTSALQTGSAGQSSTDAGSARSALVRRAKGDLATVNGTLSPAAEFLRSKRTWQGLGSDYEIDYERDENGKIRGAVMEEGRSGVAKGYTVGGDDAKS